VVEIGQMWSASIICSFTGAMSFLCLSKAGPNESLPQPYFNYSLAIEGMQGIPLLPAVFTQNSF